MTENTILKKMLIDTGFALLAGGILLIANINDQEPFWGLIKKHPVLVGIVLTVLRYLFILLFQKKVGKKEQWGSVLLPLFLALAIEFYTPRQAPSDPLMLLDFFIGAMGSLIGGAFYRYGVYELFLESTKKRK